MPLPPDKYKVYKKQWDKDNVDKNRKYKKDWKQKNKLKQAKINGVLEESEIGDKQVKELVDLDRADLSQKMKLKIIQKKYSRLLREKVLQEELVDVLKTGVSAIGNVTLAPKIKVIKGITVEDAAILLSDAHIGEEVSFEETGGFGNYDFEMFVARMEFLFDKIIDLVENKMQGYRIKTLHVCGLGDFVSGIIHDELVETASDTVVEWMLGGALILSQFLMDLCRHFERVEFVGVVGNHGRLTQKVRFKKRYVNWDYLLYVTASVMCVKQQNLSFELPKSFFTLKEMAGQNYLLLHGDNIRSYRSIPWYGIERAVNEFSQLLTSQNKIFQHVFLAHFHNQGVLDKVLGEVILNGSLIGGNEYSLGRLFKSSDPKQLLLGLNSKYGPTWRFPINLKDAKKDRKVRYFYDKDDVVSKQVQEIMGEL